MDVLQKILTVSVELFSQYGFKTITMDDVARRAGISKKTLYQHFVNKHEVVQTAVVWYQSAISAACIEALNAADNAVEGMALLTEVLNQMFKRINPLALLELQRFFPEAYKLFRASLFDKDMIAIRDNINRGIEEGNYRAEINADLLATYRMETCLTMMQPNLLLNARYSTEMVGNEIFEHFIYGLMTAKGVKLYHKFKEKQQK